jgi:hypothetical protein
MKSGRVTLTLKRRPHKAKVREKDYNYYSPNNA